MTTLYNNEALGSSSIISENRQKRPSEVKTEGSCPFCAQNTAAIEKIFMETITSDGEHIRIVNNKYPVCQIEEPLYGRHDVVIETMDHYKKPYRFSKAHWHALLMLMQSRWHELASDPRIHFIQLFKNEGAKAGASIMHAHWQIVALEEVPYTMLRHYEAVKETYEKVGCHLCSAKEEDDYCIIKEEMWRLVVPEGASLPYESWIIPNTHISEFGQIEEKSLLELAGILQKALRLYEDLLPHVSYNLCVMSGRPGDDKAYHFFIKILPRTGNFAGFELATGCYINVLNPCKQAVLMKERLKHLRGNNLGDK